MDHPAGYSRKSALGCLLIIGALVACMAVTTLGLDAACYSTLSRRMPMYPNAEVRTERHNLFRPMGMGETYYELYTPDPPGDVRSWYGGIVSPYAREAVVSGDPIYGLARSQYDVARSDEGPGSSIRLYGRCVQ